MLFFFAGQFLNPSAIAFYCCASYRLMNWQRMQFSAIRLPSFALLNLLFLPLKKSTGICALNIAPKIQDKQRL
jgi:hypothetical protein